MLPIVSLNQRTVGSTPARPIKFFNDLNHQYLRCRCAEFVLKICKTDRTLQNQLYLASALICLLVSLPTGMALGQEVQPEAHHEARAWLEFNHHLGGMVVLVLASLTWLEMLEIRPTVVIRFCWPSCLILIGLYNVILSDKFAWPIGPSGLVESLSNPEVLQHKVLAVSVLTLGLIELLRRLELMTHIAWL